MSKEMRQHIDKFNKFRLTESENLNISDVRSSENIKEDFDPMVGIDNFLNNPAMIALATAWLLMGKYKVDNLKGMKNDFLDYCNSMGYTIDKEVLDFKFNQLINRVKKIINM